MNIVIFGGAGFIGSHLAEMLVKKKHSVRILSRCLNGFSKSELEGFLSCVDIHIGSFLDESAVDKALVGMDVVVHLVSTTLPKTSNENIVYDIQTNLIATVKLLDLCKKHSIKKIVYASSGGTVYGKANSLPITESHATNPLSSYGITKLAIEKYMYLFEKNHNIDCIVLRIANPYGPRQNPNNPLASIGAVTAFLWRTLNQEKITIWGDGNVTRDYFYIEDLVSAFLSVIENNVASTTYNIASGQPHTLNEIVSLIEASTGIKPVVEYLSSRNFDVPSNYLDISKARREISWQPNIDIEEGMKRSIHWLKKIRNEK